ncbi:filamentation induced by cAMP protein Fic [Chlorobaculum parvum NCIB 8327]|uniref:Filamentation induced by cAMP protein Fic n=1 Tax=Chlorobaculum parvum (strain DSM 263 / NCIMB 8327) TaxID=517417 RepID=B3QRL1_CHLP8|nr:Fic family protein [Chlorobaculum parvum]ACF10533.1 filamentation induced by cAMP protein Fic [Chlorobaculum parvum NCIB 8327]
MKEVMTFKAGKFVFCDQYDKPRIEKLLVEAKTLSDAIHDLPILPKWASKIDPELLYSSVAGTAAIEGNSLNAEEVRELDEGKIPDEGHTAKDRLEITNLIDAYKMIDQQTTKPSKTNALAVALFLNPNILAESHIRDLHRQITSGLPYEDNIPGTYRNGMVKIGDKAHGGIYTPPKIIEDIEMLMREFIDWINSDELLNEHVFVRAALAHYHFSLIHPFWDGNGRVARLIEAKLLQSAGIRYVPKMLSNYYYRNVDDYYSAFSDSIKAKKDVTPFIEFNLRGVIESLQQMQSRIALLIRGLVMRDYLHFLSSKKSISKRQNDLITLLLDDSSGKPFTLHDLQTALPYSILYRKVSEMTARRDLKNLLERKLLTVDADGRYSLNLRSFDS